MSTQRLARANRSRFFIGIGILFFTISFVAIFHSSQQQIDELRQLELQCEQQQEALSQQVQIFEKSIKSERLEHQQTKYDLQRRTKEVKELRDKTLMESNMKFGALQQNYKLLKSQNDDLTEEGKNLRESHLKEIAGLEAKLKIAATISAQQLKLRDRELDELKVQHKVLGDKYAEQQKNDIVAELAEYREHCAWRPSKAPVGNSGVASSQPAQPLQNFNAQIPIIPKTVQGNSVKPDKSTTASSTGKRALSTDQKQSEAELENAPLPTAMRLSSVAASSVTPTSASVNSRTKKSRPVPEGVVPVPPNELLSEQESQLYEVKTEAPTVDENQTNNRYANVVDEAVPGAAEDKPANEGVVDGPGASDADNGAREVLDDFLVDGGHKDHLQDVLDDVKLSNNHNNAAEDEANGLDAQKEQRHLEDNQNDEDNAILNGVGVGNADGEAAVKGSIHNNKLANDPKLMHELDADDGKVAGYPDDVRLEEANNEEEGDDDEYDNPSARKHDPAVRN